MPNNITNVLIVTGEPKRREQLFQAIRQDELGIGTIDFNKIIPMPDTVYQGSLGEEERQQYGENNWYDWHIANWGSKWNSYGYNTEKLQAFDGTTITFFTAWSSVEPIIDKLAQQYPDLAFIYCWADEDLGYNVGWKKYAEGIETEKYIPPGGSTQALELAANIHQISLDDAGYLWNEQTKEYDYQPEIIELR